MLVGIVRKGGRITLKIKEVKTRHKSSKEKGKEEKIIYYINNITRFLSSVKDRICPVYKNISSQIRKKPISPAMKVERISLVCSVMLAPCVSWIVFVKSALVVISYPTLELESLHS
jgi:hypothetical protein